ncbi:putative DNA-binding domain protein, Excisionase family (modular protein) [Nitrospira defluvii]|uniref:Putative DNA-binding domain protein, Excisionase family (Modular protein) n=1 Tax=Nitrospira defluvii TaxID=330214 RepID=D8PA14_9BACT|nr:putative DNA-binding domain protein, Excisionase family (modular protein) [Nitrospira defluvii]
MYLHMLTVKELSAWLNIKQSTLYLWVSKNKIPCRRIHGLVRFEPEAIQVWLNSFSSTSNMRPHRVSRRKAGDVDHLIEAAKRAVYTSRHGETRPTASPLGKENNDGAR